jgi:hypothetical protein
MSYLPSQRTTPELFADWAAIMRQLRDRGIIRTNNNPVGDIAEAIVAEHYGGVRAPYGQKNWDVRVGGERIEVKGLRQLTGGSRRSNVSPIRGSDYDAVVIVLLDDDFNVTEGLRIPRATVDELFGHNDHINGVVIKISRALRGHPGVEAVDLKPAAARLHAQ